MTEKSRRRGTAGLIYSSYFINPKTASFWQRGSITSLHGLLAPMPSSQLGSVGVSSNKRSFGAGKCSFQMAKLPLKRVQAELDLENSHWLRN